jgi:hypothetical protein
MAWRIQDLNPTKVAGNFSHLHNVQTGSVLSLESSGWDTKLTNHSSPSNAEVKNGAIPIPTCLHHLDRKSFTCTFIYNLLLIYCGMIK